MIKATGRQQRNRRHLKLPECFREKCERFSHSEARQNKSLGAIHDSTKTGWTLAGLTLALSASGANAQTAAKSLANTALTLGSDVVQQCTSFAKLQIPASAFGVPTGMASIDTTEIIADAKLAIAEPVRRLPLCQWPLWPKYRSGDQTKATSFGLFKLTEISPHGTVRVVPGFHIETRPWPTTA